MYSASSRTLSILSSVVCVYFIECKVTNYWSYGPVAGVDFIHRQASNVDNMSCFGPGMLSAVLAGHTDHGNDHFFQADAAMLESIPVVIDIIIVVVGVAKEPVTFGKNK